MMSTRIATAKQRGTKPQLGRRIAASASALTLAVLLTGNVAAAPLPWEDHGHGALVTPRLDPTVISRHWTRLKLATPAGYKILVYG
jgi:hypothetical protein